MQQNPNTTDRRPDPGAEWALFLDIDGTIVEIAPTPDAVRVGDRLAAVLDTIARRLGGAVAFVSGRTIADVDARVAPLHLPVAGVHGMERRDARGRRHDRAAVAGLNGLARPLRAFCTRHPGVMLEDKGSALALHYRAAPEHAEAARILLDRLVGPDSGLDLLAGKRVLEVKPAGVDKGGAIAAFMAEPPFAGRTPVFVGDDVTDEAGFAAVNALGGVSARVGNGPTRARRRFADVAAVTRWLVALAQGDGTDLARWTAPAGTGA